MNKVKKKARQAGINKERRNEKKERKASRNKQNRME